MPSHSNLFIDNGGYCIKAMYLTHSSKGSAAADSHKSTHAQTLIIPNSIGAAVYAGRGIIGDQLHRLPHYHGLMLRRPIDRGYVVDGVLQSSIWEYILQHFRIEAEEDVDVWLTTPFAAPKAVARLLLMLLSRRFSFASVTFISSSFMSLIAYAVAARDKEEASGCAAGTAVVVDVGFSGTAVVPYINYMPAYSSIVRIDVGGKLLTNRLKEHISYTQVNVMEDTWLLNHLRERCCLVVRHPQTSLQVYDKQRSRSSSESWPPSAEAPPPIRYLLPTVPALMPLGCMEAELRTRLSRQSAIDAEALQYVQLRQERFLIPELLFTPADVGLPEMGVSQAVTEGIFKRGLLALTATLLRPTLLSNVCVFGGVSATTHFRQRLYGEIEEASHAATAPKKGTGRSAARNGQRRVKRYRSDDGGHEGGLPSAASPAPLCPCHSVPPIPPQLQFHDPPTSEEDRLSWLPTIGAFYLLSSQNEQLTRLRTLAEQRSKIVLRGPQVSRPSVEMVHDALLNML